MKKPARTAALPLPLTAAALFGYGILRFLGLIDEQTYIRFTRVSSAQTPLLGCEGRIIYLNCKELYPKILELIGQHSRLQRILTFSAFGKQPQSKEKYFRIQSALTRLDTYTSRRALDNASYFVASLSEERDDIWKSTRALEAFTITLEALEARPVDITYPLNDVLTLRVPKFREMDGIPKDADIIDRFEAPLSRGRVCLLQDKHICLVVGGPPGSGKSTLSISLSHMLKQNIAELVKEVPAFSNLKVTVGFVDLDLATPTSQAIAEGWGNDRERLRKLKHPWTMELAEEAQGQLLASRARNNITIGDLPGGISDVTKLLAGSADGGILVTRDWEILQQEWFPFVRSVGLPLVSRIRSRKKSEEGFSSLVTSWRKGERLSGRVTDLERETKSDDEFIDWLAKFLLFDILPTQFEAGS